MLEVFKKKLASLAREEEGAALAVTVVVFMFMWMTCMGVYAVGAAVKEKVHLQNACDAAAYSAAVVQADTLSRIATINRAMSWTYVQMSRRQMDYVVDKWLRNACNLFMSDRALARSIHAGSGCPGQHIWEGVNGGWFIGTGSRVDHIDINGTQTAHYNTVDNRCNYFDNNHVNQPENRQTFYAIDGRVSFAGLGRQIDQDKATIRAMNTAERDLAGAMPGRIRRTVRNVLETSLPARMRDRSCFFIEQSQQPLVERDRANGYLESLVSLEGGADGAELKFLSFRKTDGENCETSPVAAFGEGTDAWFVRVPASDGLFRGYKQLPSKLVASWSWWAAYWTCYVDRNGVWHHPHTPIQSGSRRIPASDYYDSRYDGEAARPIALSQRYFGKNGTITVGLARENENPFAAILGDVRRGIYAAFNHYAPAGATSWTWCFSSAKTGWKYKDEQESSRTFKVDWKEGGWNSREQSWNLCQSDLDAVLVPVRKAHMPASGAVWKNGTSDIQSWIGGTWTPLGSASSPEYRLYAGGTGNPQVDNAEDYKPDRWKRLGRVDRTHRVDAAWGVGNRHGRFDWSAAADRMLH